MVPGQSIGQRAERTAAWKAYRDYELQLLPGNRPFAYTDGVPEVNNAGSELLGTDRMIAVFNTATRASPKEILQTVRASVDEFAGALSS